MSIPRNLGAFADNVTSSGTLNVTGINASGTPSSSTVLTGDGTWTAPSGGAMVLISTNTGSGSNYSWTGLGAYSSYLLIFSNIVVSANPQLYIRLGTSAGFIGTGYSYSGTSTTDSATASITVSNYSNYTILGRNVNVTSGTAGAGGMVQINCLSANYAMFTSNVMGWKSSTTIVTDTLGGGLSTTSTIDRIEIRVGTGTINSGTASLYGILR